MKDFNKKLKQEREVIEGNAKKDKVYFSQHEFSNKNVAQQEFRRSIDKLFDVNSWSKLPGISSTFQLYSSQGETISTDKPKVGDYILILLPGPIPENWVVITDIKQQENLSEFTVSPNKDPRAKGSEKEEIKHFFVDEATSTFRVELRDKTIYAFEIGKNEGINNKGNEAGSRKIINTLLAEGGWAGFQKFQWEKLTGYLVHKTEIKNK